MKKLFLLTALFVAAAFPSCSKHDGVETPDLPDPQPLAIAFAEGNSLQFDVDETKTVHYTITGGSGNTVVKAETQTPDDAYAVETTPTSATEGTITITAKAPTDNCVLVTVSDGSQTVTMAIVVSPKLSFQELAITFAEGNSLEFDVDETKTVHYTITGGSANNVVKVEMQNPDGAYALSTTQTSATEGTIKITAKTPTDNRVIVTVSDGSQTIMAPIDVTVILKASFDGKTVAVETPGTLAELLADYDETTITELTVIGNLNGSDISTLNNLPNLAVLDMEHVNLEELQDYAFYNNESLTSVKLPLTLKTIGNSAFWYCSRLTSITIPDSVTEIEYRAFSDCSNLTSITIPDGVTSIEDYTFWKCSSLTSVTIPDSVTSIGSYAFYNCNKLTSVTIGNGVTEIGGNAFWYCSSLTSITIPDSVTSIGENAFYGCNRLAGVYITDIAKWCAIEFENSYSNPLSYAHNLYLNGKLITDLVIPDSVTEIRSHTFCGCSSLTSITIPDGVTSIGSYAFWECSSLTSVTIPDSVTSIGSYAFYNCNKLTSVTIPDSVTSIGESAFSNCSSLTSITIPDSVTSIGSYAFYNCNKLTSVTIPDSVTSMGIGAFRGCSSLTSITIPDGVTSIGNETFRDCSSLTSIYCKAQTPPTVGASAFNGVPTTTILLYVPIGSADAYRAADYWKSFSKTNEIEF